MAVKKPSNDTTIQYLPHPKQRLFHMSDKRIKAAVCGARSGKTFGAAAEFVDKCIMQPGYDDFDVAREVPYTVAVGAPTFPMVDRVILPTLLRLIPNVLKLDKYHGTKRLLRIRGMKGETHIYFLSGKDPEGWQGQELYGVWLDEFPLTKELLFDEIQTRVSTKRGWILLTGTPRGPNWAKERVYDYSKTDKGIEEMFFITWNTLDNPYYPAEQLEYHRETMPEKYFKRTFEASWDVFEGQIYDEFNEKIHVVNPNNYRFSLPSRRRSIGNGQTEVVLEQVIAGVDWGYTHPGAIVVIGVDSMNKYWVLEESYETELLVSARDGHQDSWARRAMVLRAQWEVDTFFCDPANPEYIDQFKKHGLSAVKAKKEVHEGIESVAKHLHPGPSGNYPKLVFLSHCEACIEEMKFYHWREVGGNVVEDPEKTNDHCMDALRYAIYNHYKLKLFRREPEYQQDAIDGMWARAGFIT